jgi:hypothetical protein
MYVIDAIKQHIDKDQVVSRKGNVLYLHGQSSQYPVDQSMFTSPPLQTGIILFHIRVLSIFFVRGRWMDIFFLSLFCVFDKILKIQLHDETFCLF